MLKPQSQNIPPGLQSKIEPQQPQPKQAHPAKEPPAEAQLAIQNGQLPSNYGEQIEQVVVIAMTLLHGGHGEIDQTILPQAYQNALSTVDDEEDAGPMAIADVTMWLFAQVEMQIKSRKKAFKPVILLGAIGVIVVQVAEVATAAKIVELSDEDIQIAISIAINKYASNARKTGALTDQDLQQAAALLEKQYPQEAEQFGQMVAQRHERQQAKKQQSVAGQPQSPLQPQEQTQPPVPVRGLLKG